MDFAAFADNDVYIKLWLPERLTDALDRLSAKHDSSRPDLLRRIFFVHVYGVEVFEALVEWKRRQDEVLPAILMSRRRGPVMAGEPKMQFSNRSITIEKFGKASEDFKLWLPNPLKREIELLAKADELGVSDYARKTLVRVLLGERVFLDWQMAIGEIPQEWVEFESDQGT